MEKLNLALLFFAVFIANALCEDVVPFSEADCTKSHTLEGPICHAYLIRYFWNNTQQSCDKFIYGGCRKTANNFESYKECQQVAGNVCKRNCSKPPVTEGPMCLAYFIRYYWDNAQQRCVKFVYGGCRQTINNFQSLAQCEQVAARVCRKR